MPRITDAASAAVTSAFATRPNQFVETSRASIRAQMSGMKFALPSGSGQACAIRQKQLVETSTSATSVSMLGSMGLLEFIIPLFSACLIFFGARR